jgi:sec-independent protein translocase protein TatA
MFEGHIWEILILLVIGLLVFGPGKLPEVGSALGRGIREFRDAANGTPDMYQTSESNRTPPIRPGEEPRTQQAPIIDHREEAGSSATNDKS